MRRFDSSRGHRRKAQPVGQTAKPPRLVERELYTGPWASDGKGGRVKFAPRQVVRVHVPEPEPPAKPKTRAKAKP